MYIKNELKKTKQRKDPAVDNSCAVISAVLAYKTREASNIISVVN